MMNRQKSKKAASVSRRPGGAAMKELICRTALELFMENGPVHTTLAAVAKRAKIPPPLVHYYFHKTDDLFNEVVRTVLREFREDVLSAVNRNESDPKRALAEYVRAHLETAKRDQRRFSVWLYFYYQASCTKLFAELNTEIRDQGRERICGMIYKGMARGVFALSKDQDVNGLALEIQSMINGAWLMPFTELHCDYEVLTEAVVRRVLLMVGAKT